jgi:nitrate/TMAO reductase-like tetraheme cytochrome c subunit
MDHDKGGTLWSRIRNRAYWSVLAVGVVAGIIFWGGFNTVLEATNTMTFCISCHEMRDNVYQEYKQTIHYKNPSGVQATCSDCHVPKPWVYKFIRKIQASNELYHKALGTINTPEKFEARRLYLAERVWASMRATDSRECRNCHDFNSMDLSEQDRYARKRHERAQAQGETCIDCHDGIAHHLPERPEDGTRDQASPADPEAG